VGAAAAAKGEKDKSIEDILGGISKAPPKEDTSKHLADQFGSALRNAFL
jgi:hypothetical protein